ncbi:MAG: EAL domain-containing protein [Clostridia bacterium]|nr:EAL domain-containing protein [Clostridia bacterium]
MFIARQPIFNKNLGIYGYELLFRSDADSNSFGNASAVSATATVLGGLFEEGIQQIVGEAKAFINFDEEFLMSDSIELIASETLVIEVLETVKVDELLIGRLKYLKDLGYKIALDDFEESYLSYPIVPIADIIKYDIMATPLDVIREDVKRALKDNKLILAEKIETNEEFQEAVEMGFHLFQGYFFSKPKIVTNSKVKASSKGDYVRIIKELHQEEPSFDGIAKIIESDVNLAYRLLKVISYKKEKDIYRSIKKILLVMGLKELERWINVLMLQDFSQEKPIELTRLSLIRSKFSEFITKNSALSGNEDQAAMMCLFSMLDVLLEQPMDKALEGMMLPDSVYDALVFKKGPFVPICRLISAYEHGDWPEVTLWAKEIHMNPYLLSGGYLQAVQWANSLTENLEKD